MGRLMMRMGTASLRHGEHPPASLPRPMHCWGTAKPRPYWPYSTRAANPATTASSSRCCVIRATRFHSPFIASMRLRSHVIRLPLDQALPRELLVLMIAHHMHEGSDVKRLSLASRFFFSLVRSPELVAAWLWQRHGNDAMSMAMDDDDMAVFRQLVEVQRADVNALDDDGWVLLHEASRQGKLEYITYLLSVPGIQVNLRDNRGWTALHFACYHGHRAIVHELLQHPAVDVSITANHGAPALHLACKEDHPEVVAELLGHPGIDVNQTGGPHCMTGLHVACLHGLASVVRELLKHPDIRVNQRMESDGRKGLSALDLCVVSRDEGSRSATIKELCKHPSLDKNI